MASLAWKRWGVREVGRIGEDFRKEKRLSEYIVCTKVYSIKKEF